MGPCGSHSVALILFSLGQSELASHVLSVVEGEAEREDLENWSDLCSTFGTKMGSSKDLTMPACQRSERRWVVRAGTMVSDTHVLVFIRLFRQSSS